MQALDSTLQRGLARLRQQPITPAIKVELKAINQLYSAMIDAGENEKNTIKKRLGQQVTNHEGVLAYIQNSQ